jgi:putative transposase
VKYAFMRDHRREFAVEAMCRVLGASKSGFYAWLGRDHDAKAAKRLALVRRIADIHKASRRTYGSPRVFQELKGLGEKIAKATVERLMREEGIRAKMKRRFRATTNSRHSLPVAENLAARSFAAGRANRLWVSDITYLATDEGWLYLAVVVDCGTRKVVGWAMDQSMTAELVRAALDMAIQQQNPESGLVYHSDRGCQYASHSFRERLSELGLVQSMSRKGNCHDNAVAESFFHTLKVEHVYHERFRTRAEAKASVFEWIEVFYNRKRRHSALGYLSPECYERQPIVQSA